MCKLIPSKASVSSKHSVSDGCFLLPDLYDGHLSHTSTIPSLRLCGGRSHWDVCIMKDMCNCTLQEAANRKWEGPFTPLHWLTLTSGHIFRFWLWLLHPYTPARPWGHVTRACWCSELKTPTLWSSLARNFSSVDSVTYELRTNLFKLLAHMFLAFWLWRILRYLFWKMLYKLNLTPFTLKLLVSDSIHLSGHSSRKISTTYELWLVHRYTI